MPDIISTLSKNVRRIIRSKSLWFAGLGILLAAPVHGALVIEAPALSAVQGSSGTFDVLITDTDSVSSAAYNVEADTVELGISGTGVEFTNATINTVQPYIYSDSLDNDFGSPLDETGNPFPKTDLTAEDVAGFAINFTAINPGDTYGLVQVSYSVDPAATLGQRTLTIEDVGGGTSLSDPDGNAILFTTANGTLDVTTVPEPAAAALMIGCTAIGLRKPKRRS